MLDLQDIVGYFLKFAFGVAAVILAIWAYKQIIPTANSESQKPQTITFESLCGFAGSHEESTTSLNPAVGITTSGEVGVGMTSSSGSRTVDDYYVVCKLGEKYFLLEIHDYPSWLLMCNADTFSVTEGAGLFNSTIYKFKDTRVTFKSLSKEDADIYIQTFPKNKAKE